MRGLCLSTKQSGPCTIEEAFDKALLPQATHSYQPMPNEDLVNMINKVADVHGMKIEESRYGLDLKGQRFFGVSDVGGKDFMDGRIKLMIGFCNSYNKSMSARVCIGGKVFVCSNRAFHAFADDASGVVGMAVHSHRINVFDGLFQRINAAFASVDHFRQSQEVFYRRLESAPLNQDSAYSFVVRSAQMGVINKTNILDVVGEWDRQGRDPENEEQAVDWHNEFKPRNAYSLFNAYTEVEKDRFAKNPVQSSLGTLDLTEFFFKQFMN